MCGLAPTWAFVVFQLHHKGYNSIFIYISEGILIEEQHGFIAEGFFMEENIFKKE